MKKQAKAPIASKEPNSVTNDPDETLQIVGTAKIQLKTAGVNQELYEIMLNSCGKESVQIQNLSSRMDTKTFEKLAAQNQKFPR